MYLLDYICPDCNKSCAPESSGYRCPSCGGIMTARYDYAAIRKALGKDDLKSRTRTIWRYRELLPVMDESAIITRGEGFSPLLSLHRAGRAIGLPGLAMKDDSMQPCGSCSARIAALGVSRAVEKGFKAIVMRGTTGQLYAWASYAARAGLGAVLLARKNTLSDRVITLIQSTGATLYLCDASVTELDELAGRAAREHGWMIASPFYDSCYMEALKTIGFEIAEDYDWNMPDVIICPNYRVGAFVGLYRAMRDLQGIGWIPQKLPRLVGVQRKDYSPLAQAWQDRSGACDAPLDPEMDVQEPEDFYQRVNFMLLDAIYRSLGMAVSVGEEDLDEAAALLGELEGINAGEEMAMTLAAAVKLERSGWIKAHERVTLYNPENEILNPHAMFTGEPKELEVTESSRIPAEAGRREQPGKAPRNGEIPSPR